MSDPAQHPSNSRNHPRTEVTLPGVTTAEVRGWAQNVIEANPIASGGQSERWPDGANLELTDEPFMGVELTFVSGGRAILTLAVFADVATDDERDIMETEPGLRAL